MSKYNKDTSFIYPKDDQIKPKWTITHVTLIVVSFLSWPVFFIFSYDNSLSKILTLVGLQFGIVGSVFSSLKTPEFGSFTDGGELNIKKAKVESKCWQRGMLLIAFGFIAQICALIHI